MLAELESAISHERLKFATRVAVYFMWRMSDVKLPHYHYVLYSVLSTVEFIVGTPLNLFVLLYFLTKKDRSNSRQVDVSIISVVL